MAGQERRGTRGHGRSSRDARSWPVLAAASAAGSGSTPGTTPRPIGSATLSPDLATRSTYRSLLLRGLAPDEAANLTAFLCGIHVGQTTWSLREVNRILFLRELNRSGRFGDHDGHGTTEPH